MAYDRDEVLAGTDLAALCEEVLGPRKGTARSGTWPCPAPGHGPQTGRTPPVSVYRTARGEQRWRCHGCGAGGTALDLVMLSQGLEFRAALEALARRAGVAQRTPWAEPRLRLVRTPAPVPAPPPAPSRCLEAYVVACEAYLWSVRGQRYRRWLAGRGLDPPVLRANRVGADPGPAVLPRPRGLPRGGPAVVFPVLGPDRRPAYLQARYLGHPIRRWENPAGALVGVAPRLAEVRLARPARRPWTVVVCEGLPDALSVAQAGQRALAVLGAGRPDAALAAELVARFGAEELVLAFDTDGAGQAGADKLTALLEAQGAGRRVRRLEVDPGHGDLNGWLVAAGRRFPAELDAALAPPPLEAVRPGPAAPAPSVAEDLEALRYHHVLLDDPTRAAANLAVMAEAARRWGADRFSPLPEAAPAEEGALRAALEAFAWRHLLVDDDAASQRTLAQLGAEVRRWSAELGRDLDTERLEAPGPAEEGARILPYRGREPGPVRMASSLPPPTALRPAPPSLGLEP